MSISEWAEKTPGESETNWTEGEPSVSAQVGPSDAATSLPESKTTEGASPAPGPVATPTPPATTPLVPSGAASATGAVVATADAILDNVLGRIGDIGTNERLKLMIIGPPGQGKSSLMASADNMLAYDFEDGLISAYGSPHGVGKNTHSLPYKNIEEFRALVGAFINGDPRLAQYEVFGIDTLSDLHKRDLAEICEREWRRQPSRNRYVPETEQYTEVNERIVRVVRALRDLPIDVVITSHSKTVEPKSGPSKTYADFSESLSNKVMAMMDVVGYLQFKNIDKKMVPVLRVVTDGTIYCKTRVPMPEEIINPTYQKIKELWVEGIKSGRSA